MATKSLTAANAVITISVDDLIPTPVQLQGFSADDVFDFESLKIAETSMGVDGKLSAGFVHVEKPQSITLQADSDSNLIFDTIFNNEQAQQVKYRIQGHVVLTAAGLAIAMSNGVLETYTPAPAAKKILQPRTYRIVWEKVEPVTI